MTIFFRVNDQLAFQNESSSQKLLTYERFSGAQDMRYIVDCFMSGIIVFCIRTFCNI